MKPGNLNKLGSLAALALLAGCRDGAPPPPDEDALSNAESDELVVPDQNVEGVTPLAERVAVLGFLNKRNGLTRDLELKPGQFIRIGDEAVVRLRACERSAPWEAQALTGAFVQLDVKRRRSDEYDRVFSGWLWKESPSLNVVEHPVYDVWVKSCAMEWPDGPDAPPLRAGSPRASSASNDGDNAEDSPPEAEPAESAPDNSL